MPNSIEWTFPNTVLSDVHRITSGVGATVAVLSDLSNGKSRVCIPGRYHRRPLAGSAALKYGAFACVGTGRPRVRDRRRAVTTCPSRFGPAATAIPDSARPIVGWPGVYALRDLLCR